MAQEELSLEKLLNSLAGLRTEEEIWNDAIDACIDEVEDFFDVKTDRSVDHPFYYNSGNIEVIDFIEDQKLPFHLGNAVKYIARAGKKDINDMKTDLLKAKWYIDRYIERCQ